MDIESQYGAAVRQLACGELSSKEAFDNLLQRVFFSGLVILIALKVLMDFSSILPSDSHFEKSLSVNEGSNI